MTTQKSRRWPVHVSEELQQGLHNMTHDEMVIEVERCMAGWPTYEIEGNEGIEPENPILEQYHNMRELKEYLSDSGYITFSGSHMGFLKMGPRGNLTWCGDPSCDRVIVDGAVSLFINEGHDGEIASHPSCFPRYLTLGTFRLLWGQNE